MVLKIKTKKGRKKERKRKGISNGIFTAEETLAGTSMVFSISFYALKKKKQKWLKKNLMYSEA